MDYGKNIVQGLIDGINNGIENAKKTVGGLAKAIIDKFTTETDIHSPSKLFEQFGIYIDQGLANGITAAIPYVATAMQGVVDAVQEKGNELINAGSTQATGYVNNFLDSLDTEWQHIDQSLQADFLVALALCGMRFLTETFKSSAHGPLPISIMQWTMSNESKSSPLPITACSG